MIGVSINHELLDLYKNTSLEFLLNSPAFMGGDLDEILGSYQFPTNIPLTDRNRRILRFPERIDNRFQQLRDQECIITYKGITLFTGLATVKQSSRSVARMYIIIDSYSALKNSKLEELELDSVSFSSLNEALVTAKDTAINPLNYNFAFFPILNREFFKSDEVPEPHPTDPFMSRFQNYWHTGTQSFISSEYQKAAMPFVRIDHIINKIESLIDFSIDNQFQITDELKKLYLYNDHSIYNEDNEWNTSWNLKDHVPKIKITDFLKKFTRTFGLGIFFNRFLRKIEIIPLNDIIGLNFKHDWTDRATGEPIVSTAENFPGSLGYKSDGDDLFEFQPYEDLGDFIEVDTLDDTTDVGLYYIRSRNAFYIKGNSQTRPLLYYKKMFRSEVYGDGEHFDFEATPIFQTGSSAYLGDDNAQKIRHCPQVSITHDTNKDVRFTFYRGMFNNFEPKLYPFASNNTFDPNENAIPNAETSLLLNGEKGVFNKYHKAWVNFLKNKKDLDWDLNLHIKDIINFSWKDKVKIQNNQYFVKQMKITLTNQGLKKTKTKIVSVL